jgi:hypothetical protein
MTEHCSYCGTELLDVGPFHSPFVCRELVRVKKWLTNCVCTAKHTRDHHSVKHLLDLLDSELGEQ